MQGRERENLGEILKLIRHSRGLSIRETTIILGITHSYYACFESGKIRTRKLDCVFTFYGRFPFKILLMGWRCIRNRHFLQESCRGEYFALPYLRGVIHKFR